MKKTTIIMLCLLFITATAVSVTVWTLFFREDTVVLLPDYAPIATEPNAESIPGDNSNRVESADGGGSVSLSYSTELTVDLKTGYLTMFFANPNKSNHDMVLQIIIQDTVVVQSGRITSGKQITKLDISSDVAKTLGLGEYEGTLMVFYYDQESSEKAMVNTEIPVSITIKE